MIVTDRDRRRLCFPPRPWHLLYISLAITQARGRVRPPQGKKDAASAALCRKIFLAVEDGNNIAVYLRNEEQKAAVPVSEVHRLPYLLAMLCELDPDPFAQAGTDFESITTFLVEHVSKAKVELSIGVHLKTIWSEYRAQDGKGGLHQMIAGLRGEAKGQAKVCILTFAITNAAADAVKDCSSEPEQHMAFVEVLQVPP